MDETRVEDVMMASPYVIHPESQILDAAEFMLSHDISSAIVAIDGVLEGIITNSDLLEYLSDQPEKATVGDYMEPNVVVTHPESPLSDPVDKMVENSFHHLPVVTDSGRVVGMVVSSELTDSILTGTAEVE